MSVLIKGLKMPKDGCKDCLLVKRGRVFDICPFLKREVNGNVERGGKPYDCPLIELPDHGRLIDVDKLIADAECELLLEDETDDKYWYWNDGAKNVIDLAKTAPTIIEAERSE